MYGYVALDECRPADSRKEAIESELYIAGKDHVNYNTDYDVKAYAEEGNQKLYQGPGTKYGEVPGLREIENGETLHITEDAEMVDGSHWGVTTVDGTEGWVDLEKTEEWAAESTGTPVPTETADVTETPVPTEATEETETPTPTADEDSREASGQNVKVTKTNWYQSPFTWIIIVAVLAVAGLLIYHNKKK